MAPIRVWILILVPYYLFWHKILCPILLICFRVRYLRFLNFAIFSVAAVSDRPLGSGRQPVKVIRRIAFGRPLSTMPHPPLPTIGRARWSEAEGGGMVDNGRSNVAVAGYFYITVGRFSARLACVRLLQPEQKYLSLKGVILKIWCQVIFLALH